MRLDMGTPSIDAEMMWDNLNLDFLALPLPNLGTLVRRSHHRVSLFHAECLEKFGHVREGAVDAESARSVLLRRDELLQGSILVLPAPHLRPSEEKALIGGEAVDLLLGLPFLRLLEGRVRDRQPAEVADVLPQRELAVHMERIDGDVPVELNHDQLRGFDVLGAVFARP